MEEESVTGQPGSDSLKSLPCGVCNASGQNSLGQVQTDRVLSFETCGGLTNQRVALIQGFMLALLSHRKVVLPDLNPNGMQDPNTNYSEDRSHMLDFGSFFDCRATVANLQALGIEFAPKAIESRIFRHADITSVAAVADLQDPAWWELWRNDDTWALRLGCTLLSFTAQQPSLQQLFWSIDRALVFSPKIVAIADSITSAMQARSMQRGAGGSFNRWARGWGGGGERPLRSPLYRFAKGSTLVFVVPAAGIRNGMRAFRLSCAAEIGRASCRERV